ncbi:hypothetical protein ACFFX0_13660 [Citricoccus parietis]|uniref:Uncharacterized protein n=1 Tax=Citricoccus parietis TaxID=592307 RepID=A0ABV5G109_9MICC
MSRHVGPRTAPTWRCPSAHSRGGRPSTAVPAARCPRAGATPPLTDPWTGPSRPRRAAVPADPGAWVPFVRCFTGIGYVGPDVCRAADIWSPTPPCYASAQPPGPVPRRSRPVRYPPGPRSVPLPASSGRAASSRAARTATTAGD